MCIRDSRNSRDPEVWQYNDDLKQPVSEMLAATSVSYTHLAGIIPFITAIIL